MITTEFNLQAAIDAAVEERKEAKAKAREKEERQRQEWLQERIDWVQGTLNDLIGKDIVAALKIRYNNSLTPEGNRPKRIAEFKFSQYLVKIGVENEDFVFYYEVFWGDSLIYCSDAPDLSSIRNESQEHYRPKFLLFLAALQSRDFAEQARKDIAQERAARRYLQRRRLVKRLLDLIRF